jgi:hypothetical protein
MKNIITEIADKKSMPCNKPRRSTRPGKKMMVKACEGGREKIVHFGAKGYGHNYSSAARKSFRARHKCGEKKSKLSAQYWACRKLWAGPKGSKASCPSNRQCKEEYIPNINILAENNHMRNLTLKTLLEKKLTKGEMKERERVAQKLEKGDGWSKRYGKKGKSVKMAVATIIAKKKMAEKRKKKSKLKEEVVSEGHVVNKDSVPMSRAEIAARDKCYKSKRGQKGFKSYFVQRPDPKPNGRPDTGKERRARACTFMVLKSTRKGKGGALKRGSFSSGSKKKKAKD